MHVVSFDFQSDVTSCGRHIRFFNIIDSNTAGIHTAFIDPGSPWQNGFIESFNAQCRRSQLSGEILDTMAEAKYLAEEWKAICNHERPHGSLDGMPPKRYWETWTQENRPVIA